MRFELNVPATLDDKHLIDFHRGWRWHLSPPPPIQIDFRACNFIAPYAATLFATYILWLRKVKRLHVKVHANKESIAGAYLNEVGFFEILGEGVDDAPADRPDRVVKLAPIATSAEIPKFASNVMGILQIEDEELAGAVQYSLIELLRNVVQHSNSKCGGLAMAQYYPSTGLVEVCVADMGVGIKETINEVYPEIDDNLKAVKLATLPHVSRTFAPSFYGSMGDNAGLGLFFIKQIASLSGGSFFLASKDALIDVWGDKSGQQKKIYKIAKNGGWPGTFAYLQLRRDTIGDFDEILTVCRRTAAEARKYPAELALDFIEEVPEVENLVVIAVKNFEEDVEQAAKVRDDVIFPTLASGAMIVLDFRGVKFATQSFVHALMYKVIRDGQQIGVTLSIAACTNSTREAIMAVAAYAKANDIP